MSKERIEEVSEMIRVEIFKCIKVTTAVENILSSLPEFQDAKSEWIEGVPNEGQCVLLKYSNGAVFVTERFCSVNYTNGIVVAHIIIPPYVPEESELVKRLRPKLTADALEWVKLYEKELKNEA